MPQSKLRSTTTGTVLGLGLGLAELERRLTKGLAVMLSDERTTLDQWRVLASIADLDTPTMSELASETCLPSATLTRTVDSLVDDALVFRLASKRDRRIINVYVSEFGRQRLDRLNHMGEAWERSLASALGDELAVGLSETVQNALVTLKRGELAS